MNTKVLLSVLKRNFLSYFASPTAYLFICVFVAMSTVAAFWPNEFFSANLATLDQLNKYLPYVMLIFIPAVTMGIWADERRQGTDELLLTQPAADLEIVIGKYLAAVAIFTVSLLFSFVCNTAVLESISLGGADSGLIAGTYVGYWLVGLAMLAIGMIASFLTGNLTVAYILGVLFNLPLVFLAFSDVLLSPETAMAIKSWSISWQLEPFTRGLLTLSGVFYFVLIAAVMIYLAMVLIGRRHWPTGESRFPASVVYVLLHLCWIFTFAAGGIVLREFIGNPVTFTTLLVLGYLIVHLALLWMWSVNPNRGPITAVHMVIPLAHVVLVLAWTIAIIVLKKNGQWTGTTQGIMLGIWALLIIAGAAAWWRFPRQWSLMPGHFILRVATLLVVAASLVGLVRLYDVRLDVTEAQLASLARDTRNLLAELPDDANIVIEAFISPEVPEEYVQTRQALIETLREFDARSPKIRVLINDTELHSAEAMRANESFDISPRRVTSQEQGRYVDKEIFMGVVVKNGLQKVVIPFVDRGTPVEYELIRSIGTVTQAERKRLGILETDAHLFGQFSFQGGGDRWAIVEELEKQYDVSRVTPSDLVTNDEERLKAGYKALGLDEEPTDEDILRKGIELLDLATTVDKLTDEQKEECRKKVEEEARKKGLYDVILAVQPSSLSPEDMVRFIAAVSYGQPMVICEDPFALFGRGVPGTTEPRQAPNPMFGGSPPPKGDISPLWDKLGITFHGESCVYQRYNPIKRLSIFDQRPEFVFVDSEKFPDGLADHPITERLPRLLFPFPGWIEKKNASDMTVTPLVRTGNENTGIVPFSEIVIPNFFGGPSQLNPNPRRQMKNEPYILAAYIEGRLPEQKIEEPEGDGPSDQPTATDVPDKKHDVRVVLVADSDVLQNTFFELRRQGLPPEAGFDMNFGNVEFILNAIDHVAGDQRFIAIRKRRPNYPTLKAIDLATRDAREQTAKRINELRERYDAIEKEEDEKIEKEIEKIRAELEEKQVAVDEILRRVAIAQRDAERRKAVRVEQERERIEAEINRIETELALQVQRTQRIYKMVSVFVPPLFPLALAVIVFAWRRAGELQGVSERRRRSRT
ncbi:MAG: hypothetical protein D6741_16410 [Planctomycetota bacterium]|nr:MAG: hypothetical protein D6741_16410 [Planctomycetota bacterium]